VEILRLRSTIDTGCDDAIQRDWELAHADSCGVPNGIRDRASRASDPDLAHALDPSALT